MPKLTFKHLTLPLMILVAVLLHSQRGVDAQQSGLDAYRQKGYTVNSRIPIYSQVIEFSYPRGFKSAHEHESRDNYIHEWIPEGETLSDWSRMITLTGIRGLSSDPNMTPEQLLSQIASGFKRACPSTFAAKILSRMPISGHNALSAVVGCGSVNSGPARSEIAILIAIQGSSDYYTIQLAERSAPLNRAPKLEGPSWNTKINQLKPIKLCKITANESWPYPSCMD
ncbi:MAG TPA: hypothetical protein ACN46T_02815 [Prochlorococcus sp.]